VRCFVSAVLLLLIATSGLAADKKEEEPKPAQSIPELQQQIEKILKDTHTPGVAVAIVHKDGPEWIAGLGIADVASNRANTADTLFRIGSTSKAFTSLSILMLKDQGKLSLDNSVHKLVPDVWFDNRWEATDPVRVVNLLEHTTGWDDIHFREYAKQAPDSMTLREGLDYDHHSRTSRWRPGTRTSYCNSGPPVAAYIVERLTGVRFEDFVQQNLFIPIGMKTATYFEPPKGVGTTLYHDDGITSYSYWHILMRPAGSINASANDMAAYVQFYLNRGASGGKQIVPSADIDRMESPTSTWAAKDGLKTGYGLSNYWDVREGFTYHGHDGGVEGGITDMSYMLEYGVGYFYSINTGNSDAFDKIGKAIRAYITSKLQKPSLPPEAPLPASAGNYAGWYEPDSPRIEITRFLGRLIAMKRVTFRDGKLLLSGLGSWNEIFVPVTDSQFRHVSKKDPPDPVPSLILITPKLEGRYIEVSTDTLKKIPAWFAIVEILLTIYVLLSMVAIGIYAPFWIIGGFRKERRRPAERPLRLWPLLAVLSLVAFVAIFIVSSDDLIPRMGNMTGWSVSLWAMSLLFGVTSLASALISWRKPEDGIRPGVRRFAIIVSLGLLIAALYLAYWGIIGIRTWA